MEEALRAFLLAQAPLTALIDQRLDWDERPQGDPLPGVVLYLISDIPEMKMTGPTGWRWARVQADCWSVDAQEARDICEALCTAVSGLRTTLSGIRFRIFVIDGDRSRDELSGQSVFRARADLRVIYQP